MNKQNVLNKTISVLDIMYGFLKQFCIYFSIMIGFAGFAYYSLIDQNSFISQLFFCDEILSFESVKHVITLKSIADVSFYFYGMYVILKVFKIVIRFIMKIDVRDDVKKLIVMNFSLILMRLYIYSPWTINYDLFIIVSLIAILIQIICRILIDYYLSHYKNIDTLDTLYFGTNIRLEMRG